MSSNVLRHPAAAPKPGSDHRNFNNPTEVRTFEKGKVELVTVAGVTIGRMTLEPGWRWSKHVKPIVGTIWCEAPHFQYVISGKLHVIMADGEEFDLGAGDVNSLPSGHDAYVVGNTPVVAVDWAGAVNYAKQK
jgi:quercetin dioxygenase-like cupin family protein